MNKSATQPKIVMYGAEWCADCKLAKQFFADFNVKYELHDIDTDPGAQEAMLRLTNGNKAIPAIIIGTTLVQEPSYEDLKKY